MAILEVWTDITQDSTNENDVQFVVPREDYLDLVSYLSLVCDEAVHATAESADNWPGWEGDPKKGDLGFVVSGQVMLSILDKWENIPVDSYNFEPVEEVLKRLKIIYKLVSTN